MLQNDNNSEHRGNRDYKFLVFQQSDQTKATSLFLDKLQTAGAKCFCLAVSNLSTAVREYVAMYSVGALTLAPYILTATPTMSVAGLLNVQQELERSLKAQDIANIAILLDELTTTRVDVTVLQATSIVEMINVLRYDETLSF